MSVMLDACRRKPTAYTPIWIMRQAGRYQPEYRALRAKLSFIEMCQKSEVAAEVTLRPVEQLGVQWKLSPCCPKSRTLVMLSWSHDLSRANSLLNRSMSHL